MCSNTSSNEPLHPRDAAIRDAIENSRPVPPRRMDCTGCEWRAICSFPCNDIEAIIPPKKGADCSYPDRWKWRRTQYVLDHEDDFRNERWRFIVRNYFREGWSLDKVADCLGIHKTTVERDIERIVAECWRLDRWRNRLACVTRQREESESAT